MRDDQGRTRGAVLRQFAERTGKLHPDLDVPEPHQALAYLVAWWRELDRRRADARPISHQDIAAWAQLTGRVPTRTELDAILRMDDACLGVHVEAEQKRAAAQKGTK